MKGLLFAAAALVLAAPVLAAPPQVTGRAYVVENGTTGELLAARDARARVPIASISDGTACDICRRGNETLPAVLEYDSRGLVGSELILQSRKSGGFDICFELSLF